MIEMLKVLASVKLFRLAISEQNEMFSHVNQHGQDKLATASIHAKKIAAIVWN